MALLAATIGLDKRAMVDLVGDFALMDVYAQNEDGNITKALNVATSDFRSAAIKGGYSATDIDALTGDTCPDTVKQKLKHLGLDELTSGGMSRPDEIAKYGDAARTWLSRLAGGAETIDGLSRATSTGGTQLRISAPEENVFDRCNTSQRFNSRDPRL
jgi:hypothetical protein